jgi:hypothetical protein
MEAQWLGHLVYADDVAGIVDSQHLSGGRTRKIDGREFDRAVHETVNKISRIEIRTDNYVAVINAVRAGGDCARTCNVGVVLSN